MTSTLTLGQPLAPGVTTYHEGDQLRLTPGLCELVRFVDGPTAQEIQDISSAELEFALVNASTHLLLLVPVRHPAVVGRAVRGAPHRR